jgi:hypothetical protein
LRRLGWSPRRNLDEILDDFLTWVGELANVERYFSDAQQRLLQMSVLRMSHAR